MKLRLLECFRRGHGALGVACLVLLLLPAQAQSQTFATYTAPAKIGTIQIYGWGPTETKIAYFSSATGNWVVQGAAAAGCASSYWAYVMQSNPAMKEMVSTVMLAKTLGKSVAFYGECTGPSQIEVYIAVMTD